MYLLLFFLCLITVLWCIWSTINSSWALTSYKSLQCPNVKKRKFQVPCLENYIFPKDLRWIRIHLHLIHKRPMSAMMKYVLSHKTISALINSESRYRNDKLCNDHRYVHNIYCYWKVNRANDLFAGKYICILRIFHFSFMFKLLFKVDNKLTSNSLLTSVCLL